MHPGLWKRARIGLIVIAAMSAVARADIELPSVPPPQPESATVKAYKGESVEIPLSGLSRGGYQLKFLIRRQPQLGALSEVIETSRTTAVVRYTHDPASGLGLDSFRYAVQAPNTGVSTPAEVMINVVERPPVFVAPPQLEFPATAVGDVSALPLEIRNEGGGIIEGRLSVPAPYHVQGDDAAYSLGPGESRTLFVEFAPEADAIYPMQGRFSHASGAEIALAGRGFAPIDVVPRTAELVSEEGAEVRSGAVLLRNISERERTLQITAQKEVVAPESVTLAPGEERRLTLHTAPGFLGALTGELTLDGFTLRLNVPVNVAPAPPRLVVEEGAAIDFGKVESGRSARRTITLRNVGGSAAELAVDLPEGISMAPDPMTLKIEPGDSRDFEVTFNRLQPGPIEGDLVLRAGGSPVRLAIAGTVTKVNESAKVAAQPAVKAGPRIQYNGLPPVPSVGVTRQTKYEVDLAWKKTSPDVTKYVLYERRIVFEKGKPAFKYLRLDNARVRMVRTEARVTLQGFHPGERRTFQIVGYGADGTQSRPSPPFEIASKASPPLRIPWGVVSVIVLLACGGIIVRERVMRHRRNVREMDSIRY